MQHHYHHDHQHSIFFIKLTISPSWSHPLSPKTRPPRPRPWPTTNTYCDTTSLSSPPKQCLFITSTMPPSWSHPPSKKIQPSKTKTLAHLLHNSAFSTTNTIFIINNATIMVASSRPKTQSSTTPLNTPQHHQSSWPRNHIQKHIEQRKHPTKEITQRLAKHYDLLKLCLKWNDFQENILASFQEPDTTKSLPWSEWKNSASQ